VHGATTVETELQPIKSTPTKKHSHTGHKAATYTGARATEEEHGAVEKDRAAAHQEHSHTGHTAATYTGARATEEEHGAVKEDRAAAHQGAAQRRFSMEQCGTIKEYRAAAHQGARSQSRNKNSQT